MQFGGKSIIVEFRVRTIRITIVIYIKTLGQPDRGKSSTCFGSTGVLGIHPRETAFDLRLYIKDCLTLVS
jgi:hypothetical protein